MNSLNFQKTSNADIKQLLLIENSCHSHPWSEKTFKSCIGGRYFGEYATQNNDQIIGFYVGEHVAGEATLMDICVEPSLQGKGYGKALLLQFLQHVKMLAATKVFLEVRASNISAQMLYMNHDFIEINRRTGYYPSAKGFGYEDAIVMCLTI
jgi:[ribosomal protein S18]-alanine N-acetyltransferase